MRENGRRLDLPRDDPLIRVALAPTEIDAELLTERLRQRGVDAVVRIEDDVRASTRAFGSVSWAYPIYVLESDIDRARDLIAEMGHIEPEGGSPALRREILLGSLLTIGITLVLILALMARSY